MKQFTQTIRCKPGYQRGLSLIELMVSITIGLLILVTLSSMFINQSKARVELDKSNRMIDNGRYAIDLLSNNLKLAGYFGTFAPSGALTVYTGAALPDPCDAATITNVATNVDLLRLPVQGVNATTTATPAFSTACATVANANGVTLKPGSDILVIRRAGTTAVQPTAVAANTTYLQVSSCPTDPVFPNNYLIAKAPAVYSATTFPLLQRNCAVVATPAMVQPFLVQVYFVSTDNNPGDGIPTLKRLEFDSTGGTGNFVVTPLVEGIEYMQIDYGVDTAPDGVPDSYVDCSACAPADWTNVVAVKINLLARNQDPTRDYIDSKTYDLGLSGTVGPFNAAPYNAAPNPTTYPKLENYKRHVYTQTVRLVNPSSRRETPCTAAPCR